LSRGISIQEGQLLARGLKITRSTHLLIAAVATAVAANATVAVQFTGLAGLIVLLALIFGSLAVGTSAISADIYSRSSQTVSNLRSIGASSKSISSAVLVPVLAFGIAGSALGAVVGAALGITLGGSSAMLTVLVDIFAVIGTASAASAAGVYAGGRAAWRS
jgi:predicted lysophospholipase L1 biosynthesis ABC-type transport system permease subunit